MPEAKPAEVKEAKPEKPVEEYGPNKKGKRLFTVPHPGVSINGKWWIGKMQLTYDEKANVQSILSARAQHEIRARVGDKEAQTFYDLGILSGGGKSEF